MYLHSDLFDPAELTGYVRTALADQSPAVSALARWLPNRVINDLQYRFTSGGEGLVEAAGFRAWDTESPLGERPGTTRVAGNLPPISRKVRLGEYALLRKRANEGDPALPNQILDDATRLAREIAARIDLARGDALVNGTITINENGVVATVDFGRDPSHKVASATSWTDTANATALTDIIAWHDAYVATNGIPPRAILTSTRVRRLIVHNAEIIAAISGTAAGRTKVETTQLADLFEDEGLPPIFTNDVKVNVDGIPTRLVDEDYLLLLPSPVTPDDEASALGSTLWGTTSEALDDDYGLPDEDQPGIVAGVYTTPDPIAYWTKAAGIGLPVMANPDLTLAADVI